MPPDVLQRFAWTGSSVDLGDLFVLPKGTRVVRGALFSHQFGWELRLLIGPTLKTSGRRVVGRRMMYSTPATNG
jgi:hypothetical protein